MKKIGDPPPLPTGRVLACQVPKNFAYIFESSEREKEGQYEEKEN